MKPTRITRTDVAVLAKVSKTTVSFVLNDVARSQRIAEETIQRVLDAIHELNYAPRHHAQVLAGRSHTRCLGIAIRRDHRHRSQICRVLMRHAQASGWMAGVCPWAEDDPERWQKDLVAGRYDRLVCIGDWPLPAAAPACLHIDSDGVVHGSQLHYDRQADCRRLLAACPVGPRPWLIDAGDDPACSHALRDAVGPVDLGVGDPQTQVLPADCTAIIAIGDRACLAAARLQQGHDCPVLGIGLMRPSVLPPQAWGSCWPINACAAHLVDFLEREQPAATALVLGELLSPDPS